MGGHTTNLPRGKVSYEEQHEFLQSLHQAVNRTAITRDEWYDFIAINEGWMLQYVPQRMRDYDMCLVAVNDYGLSLQYVPENLRDYSMCRSAVQSTMQALQFVPVDLVGRDFLEMIHADADI
jgi:hypothetical protein